MCAEPAGRLLRCGPVMRLGSIVYAIELIRGGGGRIIRGYALLILIHEMIIRVQRRRPTNCVKKAESRL